MGRAEGRRELSVSKQRGGSARGRDWYFGDGFEPREMLGLEPRIPEYPSKTVLLRCAAGVTAAAAAISAVRMLSHDPNVSPHAAWQTAAFLAAATVSGRMALWRWLRHKVDRRRYVLADLVLLPMAGGVAIAAWAGSATAAAVGTMVTLGGLLLSGLVLPRLRWFRRSRRPRPR